MSYKILVIDDDVKNLDITSRLLVLRRYEVITASDGVEGIGKAAAENPDLILMDLKMPRMDGYEATGRLKADPQTQAIPIIVVSASALKEQEDRAVQAGCDEFVRKPIDWPDLFERIELLLREETSP